MFWSLRHQGISLFWTQPKVMLLSRDLSLRFQEKSNLKDTWRIY
jgi:hypothetical protein